MRDFCAPTHPRDTDTACLGVAYTDIHCVALSYAHAQNSPVISAAPSLEYPIFGRSGPDERGIPVNGLSNAVATSDSCNRASFLTTFVQLFLSLQKYHRPGQAVPNDTDTGRGGRRQTPTNWNSDKSL